MKHKLVSQKHSAELQNAANLISQAVNASSVGGSLNNSHLAPPNLNMNNSGGHSNSAGSELAELNMKMSQLIGKLIYFALLNNIS